MKVAFIVNSYPPRVGGLEQHLGNLSEGLANLGVDVSVITIDDRPSSREDAGVKILTGKRHFPIADVVSFPRLGARRNLTKFLIAGKFDAVSIHTRFFPMSFIGLRAARKAGIPVVHTEHGSGPVASESLFISLPSRIVDQTLGRYVLKSADHVLGVSDEAAGFAKHLGASETETFFNAIPAVTQPENVEDRPNRLVFVGRMVPGKGWDLFIKAVAALLSEGNVVDGVLLGDGQSLEEAREMIRELGLERAVEVRGQVEAKEVRKTLQGATLVNPTILSEGFQTTLLETLAEQGRVVTFPVPGATLLQEQGAPVVITKERTLESLVAALRQYLQAPPPLATSEMVSPWTWPNRSKEYLEILETVVKRRHH